MQFFLLLITLHSIKKLIQNKRIRRLLDKNYRQTRTPKSIQIEKNHVSLLYIKYNKQSICEIDEMYT